MKIKKTSDESTFAGIHLSTHNDTINQLIEFETDEQRDIVFDYWTSAIDKLNMSKAIYRPVYEQPDGETRILKLRYATTQEIIEVDKAHKLHFPDGMKLVMIYNEKDRLFINVI